MRARADLFALIRHFFDDRGVMEVDTPLLSAHATVDRHIESFSVVPGPWSPAPDPCFLHTSPEFAMKRLLAAGSGPIYQICHVFRAGEAGRLHNPEFTLLEWYRPGWDHHRLMDEVAALLAAAGAPGGPYRRTRYRDVFAEHTGLDPFTASPDTLRAGLAAAGIAEPECDASQADDRDFWLDLWMSVHVGPRLGRERPEFVYDFPASQAALARVRADDPPVAERFELFWDGMELANGFHELCDAAQQRQRFEADQSWRRLHGRPVPPYDRNLIAALEAGLPDCAGVALGLDRLLMRLTGASDVAGSMPFDTRCA